MLAVMGKKPTKKVREAASIIGKLGASKGGITSSSRLSPAERVERGKRAIAARWAPKWRKRLAEVEAAIDKGDTSAATRREAAALRERLGLA